MELQEAPLTHVCKILASAIIFLCCLPGHSQADSKPPIDVASMQAKAAEGDTVAMTKLGEAYWGKQGIPADFDKGKAWLEKAALGESIEAQMFLGAAYLVGDGVPKDPALAARYLLLVAQRPKVDPTFRDAQGLAQFWMAMLYEHGAGVERSHSQAIHFLELSAENGNPGAEFDLASLYNNGTGGMAVNKSRACQLFESAANQGHIRALHNAAYCYQTGTGIAKDLNKAANFYARAAEGGSARSEFNLAMVYGELGNAEQAFFWLLVAQSSNYPVDHSLLDQARAHLSVPQIKDQESRASLWVAAHPIKKPDNTAP